MDRRSWLWRRRSSDKNNIGGETESSRSVSSRSDEQEGSRGSPSDARLLGLLSKEKESYNEEDETVKNLNEKLSAAILTVNAKEGLAQEHAKIAQEAVLGWEKAEEEILVLKNQLSLAAQKNSGQQERIGQLDGALKECVRQLRLVREEQQQKIDEALFQQSDKWESEKIGLKIKISELQAKLDVKSESSASDEHEMHSQFGSLKRETSTLKKELLMLSEALQVQTMEKELSTRAAETASRQHLESARKVAKLEAECQRLQAAMRRSSLTNDSKPNMNHDRGKQLSDSCSDSRDSSLMAEQDQFSGENKSRKSTSITDINLMDDFLQMEQLAAKTRKGNGDSMFDPVTDPEDAMSVQNLSKQAFENMQSQLVDLEEKVKVVTAEKTELERVMNHLKDQLRVTVDQLARESEKVLHLQRQINLINGEKSEADMELKTIEADRYELKLELESAHVEIRNLKDEIHMQQGQIQGLKALSAELSGKCQGLEVMEESKRQLELQLQAANTEISELGKKISLLDENLKQEKAISTDLAIRLQNMEIVDVKKKEVAHQLELAQKEIELLHDQVTSLKREVVEKTAVCSEYESRYRELEMSKEQVKNLDSQLVLAQWEIRKLLDKVADLERTIKEETELSSELATKCHHLVAQESRSHELEALHNFAVLENEEFKRRLSLLERKYEHEKMISAEKTCNLNASELERKELCSQLDAVHEQVTELGEKLRFAEERALRNKIATDELAEKCHKLENELKMNKRECSSHITANGSLKMNQENGRSFSLEKLAQVQTTITNISKQLKSLTTLDNLLFEVEDDEDSPPDIMIKNSMLLSPLTEKLCW